MPEGHVIHRLAAQLNQLFAGHALRVTSPQGRFAEEAGALTGDMLDRAEAWGKHLFLSFGNPRNPHRRADHIIHIHLGLIGTMAVEPFTGGQPRGQVRLHLHRIDAEGGEDMCTWGNAMEANLRGPQWCRLITDEEMDAAVAKLGADPLRSTDPEVDPENAAKLAELDDFLSRSRRTIGSVLMDQARYAGVGNIYRAETLFRLGIHPDVRACDLAAEERESIWQDLVELMAEGEASGRIDTVRPEHTPEAMERAPRKDDHGGEVYVYRRAGQPCYVCGEEISHRVVQGRNLFWCPGCQPLA
ncbi:Fpg/Nei family DNA glycosylase [Corynebacterium sp. HMSC27B11]|uniref:Fpg/Nei family DNA glycosylase n=1 Tax=Corynebacterium sp. HMSC27B11 TaxID=1581065 RepID=UPI0008A1C295|nr:DNA-formamidopyrimidine glycosylase family protein [Corynebacterium sp. HMSC27B11]OFS18682.1 DNA glycosylase [Corynebacterium sp. HMSC27B11]